MVATALMDNARTLLALAVVAASFWFIVRRHDIRLSLLGGGLILASLGGQPLVAIDTFTRSMVAAMVAPICAAMGFAAVLRETGCDRHLVRLLMAPLRRRPQAVLPGGILASYLVNLAVPSQSSVAAMLGPILIPLLNAAGFNPSVAGAALILGASFGGDLLNPAAQDVQALAGVTAVSPTELSRIVIPASLVGMVTAAFVFSITTRRSHVAEEGAVEASALQEPIHWGKALVPLAPVALLLLAHAGWKPLNWLLHVDASNGRPDLNAAIPVVRALFIGLALTAVVGWRDLRRIVTALFDGMGTAYRDVISLTIVARCFGAGIAAVGLGNMLLQHLGGSRWSMGILSIAFPWILATLSGSGSGPVLAYAQACLAASNSQSDLPLLGALTCLGAAFGRTTSPVSAVVLCSAGLVAVSPAELILRLLPALSIGAAAAFLTTLV